MKHSIYFILLVIGRNFIPAQTDTTVSSLQLSGYTEIYYCYDFGNPRSHTRPDFFYSYNRHNEVNLNLGLIKAAYSKDNVRANLGLMAGTYPNSNLKSEPGVLKNLFEANIGVKLLKRKNLWFDAGIFPSHIGFESAIGKDCWNLTRSILAENSPYYESGAKLSCTSKNEKWFISALLLNGWKRIQKHNGNNSPAFGHQLIFKPNSKLLFNSSSFVGNDKPDSVMQMRYFHNFYAQLLLHKRFGVLLGFDFGSEQKAKDSHKYNNWYSPVLIVKYSPLKKLAIAARAEYYSDEHQVIIATGTVNGFQTFGYSLNVDYLIADNVLWRIEGRNLSSLDPIFIQNKYLTSENYFVTSSISLAF